MKKALPIICLSLLSYRMDVYASPLSTPECNKTVICEENNFYMAETHSPYDGEVIKNYPPNSYVVYRVVQGKKVQENRYEYDRLVYEHNYRDDGKYDGIDYGYDDSGIRAEMIFKDGKLHIQKNYHPNGRIHFITHFKDGREELIYLFNEKGMLEQTCNQIIGKCDYYSNGKKIEEVVFD